MEQQPQHSKENSSRITRSRVQKETTSIPEPSNIRKSTRNRTFKDSILSKYEQSLLQSRRKKIKPEIASPSKKIDLADKRVENHIESGSTTEISQDGESNAQNQPISAPERVEIEKSSNRDNIEEESNKKQSKTISNKPTKKLDSFPRIIRTDYDEGIGDLVFKMKVGDQVVEKPRFELIRENPLLILYFYEMHIEFTDPSECGTIALERL